MLSVNQDSTNFFEGRGFKNATFYYKKGDFVSYYFPFLKLIASVLLWRYSLFKAWSESIQTKYFDPKTN